MGSWIYVEMLVRGLLDASEMIKSWILLNDGLYGLSVGKDTDMLKLVRQIREGIREVFSYIDHWFRVYCVASDIRVLNGKQYIEESRMAGKWKGEAFYLPDTDYLRDSEIRVFSHYMPTHMEQFELIFQERDNTREELKQKIMRWCQETHLWPQELKKMFSDFAGRRHRKAGDREIQDAFDIRQLIDILVEQCYSALHFTERNEVRKTIQIIQEEYQKDLTLFEIADRIGINSQYLGRLFQEETQEKFSDYLNRVRMEHASGLLKEGNLKIYEVAERVGITNYRYFTQKFREWSGVSPKEIRKGDKKR